MAKRWNSEAKQKRAEANERRKAEEAQARSQKRTRGSSPPDDSEDFDDLAPDDTLATPDSAPAAPSAPPAPPAPDEAPAEEGQDDSQPAASNGAYTGLGVFFMVPPPDDPKAKTGWAIQTVENYTDNAQKFILKRNMRGCVEDYIRGCITEEKVTPVVKYLDRAGLPVDGADVPKDIANAILGNYYCQLETARSASQIASVSHLFATVAPEDFGDAYDKMSEAEKDCAAASIEEMMQVAWKNPFSAPAPSQTPPAEDNSSDSPTQP